MRRVVVRRSPVHGKGVFALLPLVAGERVLEFKGEVTSWRKASIRSRLNGVEGHTFLFGLSDGRVIDGSQGGNSARWLNHACDANCEAVEEEGRVFIETLTNIAAGTELLIRYGLTVNGPLTDEVRALYACRCGSAICSQSMLAVAT
jgi:uncharacterized protein